MENGSRIQARLQQGENDENDPQTDNSGPNHMDGISSGDEDARKTGPALHEKSEGIDEEQVQPDDAKFVWKGQGLAVHCSSQVHGQASGAGSNRGEKDGV